MKKMGFLLIIILMLPALVCKQPETIVLGDPVKLPNSDFTIRPVVEYRVAEMGRGLYIHKSPIGSRTSRSSFITMGYRFELNETQEMWLEDQLKDPDFNEAQAITVNGLSGFIANAQAEGDLSFVRSVILAAEDQGFIMTAVSSPETAAETEAMFNAMLNSVSLTKAVDE